MNKKTKNRIKRNKIQRVEKHLKKQYEKKVQAVVNNTLSVLAGKCFGCSWWSPTSEWTCKFPFCSRPKDTAYSPLSESSIQL